MLANLPWRQLGERAEKILGNEKHDPELAKSSHRVIALRSFYTAQGRPIEYSKELIAVFTPAYNHNVIKLPVAASRPGRLPEHLVITLGNRQFSTRSRKHSTREPNNRVPHNRANRTSEPQVLDLDRHGQGRLGGNLLALDKLFTIAHQFPGLVCYSFVREIGTPPRSKAETLRPP